jgi:hypothetical protein
MSGFTPTSRARRQTIYNPYSSSEKSKSAKKNENTPDKSGGDSAAKGSPSLKDTVSKNCGGVLDRFNFSAGRLVQRPARGSAAAQPLSLSQLPKSVQAAYQKHAAKLGHKVWGQTFKLDGYLFLPNADKGAVKAINVQNVPAGVSEMNGCMVRANGPLVAARTLYPETHDGIKTRYPDKAEWGERLCRQLREADKVLNADLRANLKRGMSMQQAVHLHKNDGSHMLHQLAGLAGLSI